MKKIAIIGAILMIIGGILIDYEYLVQLHRYDVHFEIATYRWWGMPLFIIGFGLYMMGTSTTRSIIPDALSVLACLLGMFSYYDLKWPSDHLGGEHWVNGCLAAADYSIHWIDPLLFVTFLIVLLASAGILVMKFRKS